MNIKEVEEKTGLVRSNIRFYEKEELLTPKRNESNGYREYSEQDISDIKKIAYLRTLGLSIDSIRSVINKEVTLYEVLEKQSKELEEQASELNKTKIMCDRMLSTENLNYDNLEIDSFIPELPDYWNDNRKIFKLDAVGFLYMWGSFVVWLIITLLCLIVGALSYPRLPHEIPVQWNNGVATSLVRKEFIFMYPIFCVAIRYLLRTLIYSKFQITAWYKDIVVEYITNFMCFVTLSVEIFTILFSYGVVKNVVFLLGTDLAVFVGLLIIAIIKIESQDRAKNSK